MSDTADGGVERGALLKLGVVGCGWAGRQAVLAAAAVPHTTVVAVAELNPTLRQDTASEFAVPGIYRGYQELLNNPAVEAVYLATSPDGRLPMVLESLAAGKHVLVQKPHAIRAPEILEMETAAQRDGKTLQFCYFMRHRPQNRRLRLSVRGGKIGEVYHARIFLKFNFLPPLNDNTRWLHTYGKKGGALGQHASHELDLAWWMMGCPRPEWAFAARHSPYAVYDGPEGPAEDYFSGIAGFEGGKTIQIDCSRMLHADSPTTWELYGTTGAITGGAISRYDKSRFTREEIDEPSDIPHSEPPPDTPVFFYEIEHFAMAVAGEVEPDVSAADAYSFMRLLDALYDSAREQKKIDIPTTHPSARKEEDTGAPDTN